ncbi:aminotransferase class V-fold PLP-dependent enzyme [Oceanotoga teriensis]|uniref:aminotransferase class V-fold PLP-dependent enzyme n=1 Tax=Oceanotoga teriensis TaxID=515440 RepID=UPI0027141300|nr:aminotransferase class V-fold PLP-dependent enzyme [Oceanotoga teriensis]MDO7975806.1 aminotransferase class I/II-fold pyridoxal phosphate-dependent enzyme [Oceanotoga teriensis]
MKNILLDAPNLGKLEKEYLIKCLDSTFVSTAGPFIPEFEKKFAEYTKSKKAVAVQSGTAALYMALYEAGIKPGDEVIVPVITFIATVTPVVHLGAVPVFADVNIDTWTIDPEEIEKLITNKTKAIIPVHLYGNPCDMNKINEIAKKYNLKVIEDATESLGATINGKMTGTFGDFGCFSFNGNKIMTTGGGGMIISNSADSADHIKFLINQARDASKGYYHPEIGFNYRMTNLEASLGLAQFERLDDFLIKKISYADIYNEKFKNTNIKMQKVMNGAKSSWWLPSATIESNLSIPEIQKELSNKGIPSRRIFMPIVEFPPFEKYKKGEYKNAYYIYENGINLPGSTMNDSEQIDYICTSLKEVINR